MWPKFLGVVFAVLVFAGGLFATEATVERVNGNQVDLQISKMTETVDLSSVRIVNAAGKPLQASDVKIRAGDKVDVTIKNQKIVEIKVFGQ